MPKDSPLRRNQLSQSSWAVIFLMVVEEVLDEKLKPIMRFLAKRQNEGISFVQVMRGIGFIFVIMGIILYFRSRRGR